MIVVMKKELKQIHVAAAVICKDDKIFATQRGYGEFKDGWEFPGGKIEAGESARQALVREIKEELNTDIIVGNFIGSVEYNYPQFHLSMQVFSVSVQHGSLELLEHEAARWLSPGELDSVAWLPADQYIVDHYLRREITVSKDK